MANPAGKPKGRFLRMGRKIKNPKPAGDFGAGIGPPIKGHMRQGQVGIKSRDYPRLIFMSIADLDKMKERPPRINVLPSDHRFRKNHGIGKKDAWVYFDERRIKKKSSKD